MLKNPYAKFVDAIGDGKLGYDSHSIPLHTIQELDSIKSTIQYLYPPEVLADPDKCIRSSFLSPLNQQANGYNNRHSGLPDVRSHGDKARHQLCRKPTQ